MSHTSSSKHCSKKSVLRMNCRTESWWVRCGRSWCGKLWQETGDTEFNLWLCHRVLVSLGNSFDQSVMWYLIVKQSNLIFHTASFLLVWICHISMPEGYFLAWLQFLMLPGCSSSALSEVQMVTQRLKNLGLAFLPFKTVEVFLLY